MVRSTCWLYSTLITNTTITITTITTKCSKCGGLPAWTPFYSNWHCANNSVCKTHFRVPACVFITYVYVFNMSNCEPQDVNYGNQVLQAAGKWSPGPPQAQSREHVHWVRLIRFLAFLFGLIEILWSTIWKYMLSLLACQWPAFWIGLISLLAAPLCVAQCPKAAVIKSISYL